MLYSLRFTTRHAHHALRQVARAKVALQTNLMLTTATTEGACEDVSQQVIGVGRRVPAAELFARIDALSTADVRATANKFINDQVSIKYSAPSVLT
jgi:mitochondrial-processing peptidase subunit beta